MSLSGFGISANANAPASAEVMKYAPASADYFAYVDLEAIVPGNYKVLAALPKQASVKANRQVAKAINEIVNQAETGRMMLKQLTGVDPITDVKSAALWVNLPDAGDPIAIIAVRGNFPSTMLDGIASKMGGTVKKYAAGSALPSPDGKELLALTTDSTLLFGSAAAIEARIKSNWRPQRARKNSNRARVSQMIDAKPFFMFASSPGKSAIRRISREVSGQDEQLIRDLLVGHKLASLSLYSDGIGWSWRDRSRTGYESAVMASEGLIELFRGTHYSTRGLVRLAIAALGSYRGAAPEIDAILRHKDQIIKLVTNVTGDGQFATKVDIDNKALSVTVRATGKSLSDVVPVIGVLPIAGAFGYLMLGRSGMGEKHEESAHKPAKRATHKGLMKKKAVKKPATKAR